MKVNWFKVGLGLTAGVATATSGWHLVSLTGRMGWVDWSGGGLPVSLDVLAALAIAVWMNRALPRAKRVLGKRIALACLSVSTIGNAVEGGLRAAETGAGFWMGLLSVLMGTVPPIAAFAGFWLLEGDLGKPAPKVAPKPEPKAEPIPETKVRPTLIGHNPRPTLVKEGEKRPRYEAKAWIAQQETRPTKRDVTSRFSIGGDPALALIKEIWDKREAAV